MKRLEKHPIVFDPQLTRVGLCSELKSRQNITHPPVQKPPQQNWRSGLPTGEDTQHTSVGNEPVIVVPPAKPLLYIAQPNGGVMSVVSGQNSHGPSCRSAQPYRLHEADASNPWNEIDEVPAWLPDQ